MITNQQPFPTKNPTLPFWKQYWYVVLFLVAGVLLAISYILKLLTPPSPIQENTWQGITPGYSTEKEIINKLGEPVNSSQTSDGKKLEFKPDYKSRINNEVILDQQGKVAFIREYYNPTTQENVKQYIEKYGQPDLQLNDKTIGAVNAYVFLKQGIVIIAHINDGVIEQKWGFVPTTSENFLISWGKTLSSESSFPEGGPE